MQWATYPHHMDWCALRGRRRRAAFHTPVASLNFASITVATHSLIYTAAAILEQKQSWEAQSVTGGMLAGRWMFGPLTRLGKLRYGTIQPKTVRENLELTYGFGKRRRRRNRRLVVNPNPTEILQCTVWDLSATRGTPPRDPSVRDWGIFFYNSVTLPGRVHDIGRGFILGPNREQSSSGDKGSHKAQSSYLS